MTVQGLTHTAGRSYEQHNYRGVYWFDDRPKGVEVTIAQDALPFTGPVFMQFDAASGKYTRWNGTPNRDLALLEFKIDATAGDKQVAVFKSGTVFYPGMTAISFEFPANITTEADLRAALATSRFEVGAMQNMFS